PSPEVRPLRLRRAPPLDSRLVVVAAERVEPAETVWECSDPKDDWYLALTGVGRADVIVSSDARHLLSMDPWRGIRILSPANYFARGSSRASAAARPMGHRRLGICAYG